VAPVSASRGLAAATPNGEGNKERGRERWSQETNTYVSKAAHRLESGHGIDPAAMASI